MPSIQPNRLPEADILCLVHRVPYPPNRGDRIRSFHLLEHLARHARLHLAFPATEPIPPATMHVLRSLCHRVAAERVGRHTRWLNAAWSLASGATATEGLFRSSRLAETIRAWTGETRFDAAVVVCSSMVQYLDLPGLEGVPTVVDLVDVDSQKWFDYAAHARGPKRHLLRLEATRLRRLEASLPDRTSAVTVVADREADLFESFSPHRPHVLRNGVDLDYFCPNGAPALGDPPSCVFVGALDYQANVDGAAWFCREIWPLVLDRFPQAVFRLVGSRPSVQARRLGRLPGVDLVGEVPDVRPYLHTATIVVVPLRVARGVQNKVLEALAVAKPVIVTPQALDGLNAAAEVDLVLAATPAQWTDAVCRLLTDTDRCARLGRAGRAFVEREYRWSNQLAQLATLPGLAEAMRHRSEVGQMSEMSTRCETAHAD